MKKYYMRYFRIILIVIVFNVHGLTLSQKLDGDYLGQTPPGDTPEIFAPGIISVQGNNTHTCSFSPDRQELFFTRDPERITYTMKIENGYWSSPLKSHFIGREAIFTPDGKRLYFNDGDIWITEKIDGKWGQPVKVPYPISSNGHDYYASFTRNGTMYFSRYMNEGQARIYRSKLVDGEYSTIEDVGESLNHPTFNCYHPFVAPDESYLIFNSAGRLDGYGGADLYISFKKSDSSWSNPIDIGNTINSEDYDLCPIVTFDQKYIFFTRLKNGTGNVYWVSTNFIDSLKHTTNKVEEKKKTNPKTLNLNQNYPNPFNPSTVIGYQLPVSSNVKLKVYDTLGREIKTLIDSFQSAGEHSLVWDATGNDNNPVSSGVYFYKLEINNMNLQKKMLLVR
jgi:hypothetical protein